MASYRMVFRTTVCGLLLMSMLFVLYGIYMSSVFPKDPDFYEEIKKKQQNGVRERHGIRFKIEPTPEKEWARPHNAPPPYRTDINVPIILWWTPFTKDPGSFKKCGNVQCFFTNDRMYKDHPKTQVFLFYGTEFQLHDLPLPRQPHHEWALLHEESPKNVYLFSHEEIMTLFNHTSTFKRESDYPITTQYLSSIEKLESKEFLVSAEEKNRIQKEEGLAPLVYVQSDCGAPSDRDTFVRTLMKYIPIDSYGRCEHNKDLPASLSDPLKGMDDKEFYKLMAKYKFTITIENALCDDYITEKFWRPFHLGSVPIIYAQDKIKDFLPSNSSVVFAQEYKTFQDLATRLNFLNLHNEEYEKLLSFKTTGVTNEYLKNIVQTRDWGKLKDHHNLFAGYECYLCETVHKDIKNVQQNGEHVVRQAKMNHYGCPKPEPFIKTGEIQKTNSDWFGQEYLWSKYQAQAFKHFYDERKNFTYLDLYKYAEPRVMKDWPKNRWLKFFKKNAERSLY